MSRGTTLVSVRFRCPYADMLPNTGDSAGRKAKRGGGCVYLVAELCSPVWQKRKRTSFSPLAKAYRADILDAVPAELAGGSGCWVVNSSSASGARAR